jgi:hypothetical protein
MASQKVAHELAVSAERIESIIPEKSTKSDFLKKGPA